MVGRMDIRGMYRFRSLVKQNKKAKICFVIHIAGERKLFFYIYCDCEAKKKSSDNHYSPRYSHNADSAGLVDGAGYPARTWGCGFVLGESATSCLPQFGKTILNTSRYCGLYSTIFSNLLLESTRCSTK